MARKKIHVKRVLDGDTFIDGQNIKYRLSDVDAPEKRKPGYHKARNQLKNLIEGKDVSIVEVAKDRYRRTLVRAYIGRESVIKKMQNLLKK